MYCLLQRAQAQNGLGQTISICRLPFSDHQSTVPQGVLHYVCPNKVSTITRVCFIDLFQNYIIPFQMLKTLLLLTIIHFLLTKVESIHFITKRSPLDIQPHFANYYVFPHHGSAVYSPISSPNHIHLVEKKNQENIVLLALPQATSNMRQSSVHTDVQHVITGDNIKVPVITQSVSHTSTNITHPSHHPSGLFPIRPPHFPPQHKPGLIVHDLSVIPLHKEPKKVERNLDEYEDPYRARFRKFYGGFGQGLTFGGHGTGHGFFAYG